MSFITVAMIGAGGAILGGAIAGSGARQAASTQADAATQAAAVQSQSSDKALALQEKLYNQQVGLQEPYRQAGLTGQNRLMELLGLGGNTGAANYGQYAQNFGMSDFQADPGYAFRLAQGQKALDQQAAARGGLISGNALKAATGYGQDMASQEYQNAYNRYQQNRTNQLQPLGNLMASGQAAASNQGAAAGSYGANAGNLITGAGNAIAGGITGAGQATAAGQYGTANTFANALNTGVSSYQNQNNFNNWLAQNQGQSTYNNPTFAGPTYYSPR